MVPSLRSSLDMGSSSAFQKELDAARLPGVKVRVIAGADDKTLGLQKPEERARFIERATSLANGRAPELVPGLGHSSILDEAARRLR